MKVYQLLKRARDNHIEDDWLFSSLENAQRFTKEALADKGFPIEFDWQGCAWKHERGAWRLVDFEIREYDLDPQFVHYDNDKLLQEHPNFEWYRDELDRYMKANVKA
jgi:hypothetical protein